ncbi:MAG: hypothetical protein JWM80_465, partial [Cyanobacteria bacterium RYN_339]|nr:hypothetical protein [Cyanobacteria bacterium RYN_339]
MNRLLAATLSVALLAGCSDLSGVLTSAKAGSTAGTTVTAAKTSVAAKTASAATIKAANAAKITVGTTTAVQSAATAAKLEGDIEGYNAIASTLEASDATVASTYSLKALGTASADARPVRGADAFDAWGMDAGTSLLQGGKQQQAPKAQAPKPPAPKPPAPKPPAPKPPAPKPLPPQHQAPADDAGLGDDVATTDDAAEAPEQGQWKDPGNLQPRRAGRNGNIEVAQVIVIINAGHMPRCDIGQRIIIQPIAAKPANKKGSQQAKGKGKEKDKRDQKQEAAVPSAEAQAVKSLLALAHWNHDASDSTLLVKEGTQELSHTDGTGKMVSRKLHLKRVVKAGTGELIEAFTDLSETLADGSTNTVHWEKTLQDNGDYALVFNLEQTLADGSTKVTAWQKTVAVNGDITGTGTVTSTDKDGVVIGTETLNLGGSTATTQTVDTTAATTATTTTTTT